MGAPDDAFDRFAQALRKLCDTPYGVDRFGFYMKECIRGRQIICRDPECVNAKHCKRCTLCKTIGSRCS